MRLLALAFAVFAVVGAVVVGLRDGAGNASACSLAPFDIRKLDEYARFADVVAIGELGETKGAAIKLKVGVYFKAPEGRPGELVLNNAEMGLGASCEQYPRSVLRHEPGASVLVLLRRDTFGTGANWRSAPINTDLIPIDGGAVLNYRYEGGPPVEEWVSPSEVQELLAKIGPEQERDRSIAEVFPTPLKPPACLYGPYTLRTLARSAPIIVRGKIETSEGDTATLRVTTGFAGAADGDLLTLDNRAYSGGSDECRERRYSGPFYEAGSEALFFLRDQEETPGSGLRLFGVDSYGSYHLRPGDQRLWDGVSRMVPWEEVSELLRSSVAERDAPVSGAGAGPIVPQPAGATPLLVTKDDRTPLWAIAGIALSAGLAGGGAVSFLVLRWRR